MQKLLVQRNYINKYVGGKYFHLENWKEGIRSHILYQIIAIWILETELVQHAYVLIE